MIKINNEIVEINHFPDGTQLLNIDIYKYNKLESIEWIYEKEEELSTLIFLKKHLENMRKGAILYLKYIPNARMDRVKHEEEIFTLKYFCEVINWLNFEAIYVLDAHSNVSLGLLNKVKELNVKSLIEEAIIKVNDENLIIYMPDNGAYHRYLSLIDKKYKICYGEKIREWETGIIKDLDVITNGIDLKDKTVLMIDDIISYGGSLYHSALKLKELGVKDIYAYSSHVENSILDKNKGTLIKLLNNGTVNKLFTTDSLFTKNHRSIEIIGE